MNIFAILDALMVFFFGTMILYKDIKNWNAPFSTAKIKISELVYAISYYINGVILLFLFNDLAPDLQNLLYGIMFGALIIMNIWLWTNILGTKYRVSKHPELLNEDAVPVRISEIYWKQMVDKYKDEKRARSSDIVKDLSRKFLHFIILAVLIGIHELKETFVESIPIFNDVPPLHLRNFIYLTIAFFFLFMFTVADSTRVNHFECLPDWALQWYGKSVEMKTEKYTYISSVPFLLSLMLFVSAPFELLMATTMVSCIGDSAASVIGKTMGKHKMTHFGRYPHKSYEGFFAGMTSSFIGIIILFQFYNTIGITPFWQVIIGIEAALCFAYVDVYSQYVVDNVLNTIIPGIIMGLTLYLFIL